jgi:putative N6-adenine-specific DNA methylase
VRLPLVATCSFGLETLVSRELRGLGFDNLEGENGSVAFEGDTLALCRANLWLRTADRLWMRLARFEAHTFDELFEGTRALPWSDLLGRDAAFPVEGMSHDSQLSSVPACQSIVKKAVVESLKRDYRVEWFDETGPVYKIRVALVSDVATISLDTSGVGLHKRGYRTLTAEAPLRETLAAGLVQLSYWNRERLLVDPFCGSGTIPIEAAFIGLRRAPGLLRPFASEGWPFVPKRDWQAARREAEELYDRSSKLDIHGFDIDPAVLRMARTHLRQAGLEGRGLHFQEQPVSAFRSHQKYGVVITNPPYGERMGEKRDAEVLYKELGEVMREHPTWSVYVLTSHTQFDKFFGQSMVKKRKLHSGMLQTWYYQFPGPPPPKPKAGPPQDKATPVLE